MDQRQAAAMPVSLLTSREEVDKLKKGEVKELLAEIGCPTLLTWSADECRAKLKEKRFPEEADTVRARMEGVAPTNKN